MGYLPPARFEHCGKKVVTAACGRRFEVCYLGELE
jgi:hypothetical protein